jgi:hypothetical protein
MPPQPLEPVATPSIPHKKAFIIGGLITLILLFAGIAAAFLLPPRIAPASQVLLPVQAGTAATSTPQPEFYVYQDSGSGYSIQIPFGWNGIPPIYGKGTEIVIWETPQRDLFAERKEYIPLITVAVQDISGQDPATVIASKVALYKKGSTVVSESNTKTATGDPVAQLLLTMTNAKQGDDEVSGELLVRWTYHNGKVYLVRSQSSPSEWVTYGPLFEKVLDSLAFTK